MQNLCYAHTSHTYKPDYLATCGLDEAVAQLDYYKTRVDPPQTGFLDLPFELRIQIYEYHLPQGHTISVLKPWLLYQTKKFLLVSRQVTVDVLHLLFTRNTFEVPLNAEGEQGLRRNFSPWNRRLMHTLLITAVPIGSSYCHSEPDVQLWATMIPRLRSLQIIASQPTPPGPKMKLALARWADWIIPYFDTFHHFLNPSTTKVLVDVNDHKATADIVRMYLPSKSQFVRLERGDLIFLRGIFSSYASRYYYLLRRGDLRYHL